MAKMATTNSKKQKDFKGVFTSLKWLFGMLLGSVLALSLVLITVWGLGLDTTNIFPISKVEMNGQNYTQGVEVATQLKAIEDKGFFSVDMTKVEAELKALPWVKNIQIRKMWPDSFKLKVSEHQPLAFWGVNGVVSKQGIVLYPQKLPEKDWVVLSGPDALAEELTHLYIEFEKRMNTKALKIESMHLSDRGALSLQLANGLFLELGKAGFEKRINRFLSNFENLKAHKTVPLAKVDLRYQNGFAVSWLKEDVMNKDKSKLLNETL